MANEQNTHKARYEKLVTDREPFLRRARAMSLFTIPSTYPPQGFTGSSDLYQPYQSLGARGVNHLSSKLSSTQLPAGVAPFMLGVSEQAITKLQGNVEGLAELEQALAGLEREVSNDIDASDDRPVVIELFKHLLIAGNVCSHEPTEGALVLYTLDRYVSRRDHAGNLIELILLDKVAPETLSDDVVDAVGLGERHPDGSLKTQEAELYTRCMRQGKKWTVTQQINGVKVPGMGGTYDLDTFPFAVHRLIPVSGQHYGRSFVEEYAHGDLRSFEALSAAVTEGSAAAAKLVWLRDPNGVTSHKVLEAPNGACRTGRPGDIQPLRLDKHGDFTVAANTAMKIAERLEYVFMLHSAVQRKGERVTAEEIRYMASELDDTLGGIYTMLSSEVIRPYLKMKMARLHRQGRFPKIDGKVLSFTLTTGIDALGRSAEASKLQSFLNDLAPLGEEAVAQHLDVTEFVNRMAAYRNINPTGLVRSQADIEQQQQQALLASLATRVGPEVVKQLGGAAQAGQVPSDQPVV